MPSSTAPPLLGFFAIAHWPATGLAFKYGDTALVRERMREFGFRMALGAQPSHVRLTVLRQAGVVAGIGAAVGLAAALAVSRLVSSILFGVSPTDPLALGGAGRSRRDMDASRQGCRDITLAGRRRG